VKQKIEIVLLLGILAAGVRLGLIFYERHEAAITPVKKEARPLNPDYYVSPKKLYPFDLRSAKQLTKQPVWVKIGYFYPYYSFNTVTHRADLTREIGKLTPLQRLVIKDVIAVPSPKNAGQRQVMAIFEDAGKSYATAIGTERNDEFKFYSDDMFFVEDPHQLYKHWPADTWQAIDQHQVKPGMSEMQADFAIGIGLLQSGGDSVDRTLEYPNGGKPLTITFHDGKASEIRPGTSS